MWYSNESLSVFLRYYSLIVGRGEAVISNKYHNRKNGISFLKGSLTWQKQGYQPRVSTLPTPFHSEINLYAWSDPKRLTFLTAVVPGKKQ